MDIHLIEIRKMVQIVEVHVGRHNLVKIHPSFIKIVEEVAQHLPELMFRCCGMFAAVRPPDEPTLRRT